MEQVLNLSRGRLSYLAAPEALGMAHPAFLYPLIFKAMEICFYNYWRRKKQRELGHRITHWFAS